MRALLTLILLFANSSHAFEFGTGMAPGMQCPGGYNPAQGAYSGSDEIRNLAGNLANTQRKVEAREAKLSKLNTQLKAAKTKIRRVVKSQNAMAEIERHYKYRANRGDYSKGCGRSERAEPGQRGASAAGPGANRMYYPVDNENGGEDQENPGRYAVPRDYCAYGKNIWDKVVEDDGMVNEGICEFHVPLAARPSEENSDLCREGLSEYYGVMAKKEALDAEVRDLKAKLNSYNDDRERIEDAIAEGTYCPHCKNQRQGQNTAGTGNFAMFGVQMLGAFFNGQQQQQRQPVLVAVPRRGPPGVLPYGGGQPNMAPGVLPFPGPTAYPGRPYAAPVPGYYGVQPGSGPGQGYYGGAPGGIGQGGFGCSGTAPYGFGNPLAPQFQPFLNGQANPFVNPYANDPFNQYNQNQFNPSMFYQHPLLNQGFGPGVMPYLGNGSPNYAQFNPNNPFQQWGQAPGVLPYNGSAFGPPGQLPYASQLPNYGGNQYSLGAPTVLPYMGNMGVGNSTANPWGTPYYGGAPVQNYGYQMTQLRQGLGNLNNGLYNAPPVLPYLNSGLGSPIYNTVPSRTPVNAPAILPPTRY